MTHFFLKWRIRCYHTFGHTLGLYPLNHSPEKQALHTLATSNLRFLKWTLIWHTYQKSITILDVQKSSISMVIYLQKKKNFPKKHSQVSAKSVHTEGDGGQEVARGLGRRIFSLGMAPCTECCSGEPEMFRLFFSLKPGRVQRFLDISEPTH